MSVAELTDPDAVHQAIAEYDALGAEAFRAKYGFAPARSFWIAHNGRRYESKAIVGAAFGYQHPNRGPLRSGDFTGGEGTVQRILERLGFVVEVDATAVQVRKWFRNLRTATVDGRRAPHKAQLVLLALRRLRDGLPRLAPPAEFATELAPLLADALPGVAQPNPWEPIWRLERTVWEVFDGDGEAMTPQAHGDDPPMTVLRAPGTRCGLSVGVHDLLASHPELLASVEADMEAMLRGRARSGEQSVWWVNQGATYKAERDGGYVWAPTAMKNGRPAAHHTAVSHMRIGDVVLHYQDGRIKAIGRATSSPRTEPRPEELPAEPWGAEGHRTDVEYFELAEPITLSEIADRPASTGPFNSLGGINQGYMFGLPSTFASALRRQFADRWPTGSPWAEEGKRVRQRCVAVYVGRASEPNLDFSLPEGRWGWRQGHADYAVLEPGDLIAIGVGYTGGSPRIPADEFSRHGFRRVVLGRLTSPVTRESTPYWPDERDGVQYPHRVMFDVERNVDDITIAELDTELGGAVGEAMRLSATGGGRGVVIELERQREVPEASLGDVVSTFADDLLSAGFNFGADAHEDFVRAFLTSLAAKRFVILTGLSGSGKTKIAQLFGAWLGEGRSRIIAVRPDWTSPDALLGYENGLSRLEATGYAWNVPEALEFVLQALSRPEEPHVLVLDEMNLAHVERYFADVLSGMESGHGVVPDLVRVAQEWRLRTAGADRVAFPTNLFVVGTVNVDETTYMFSPKVLDRANTIEFRVPTEALGTSQASGASIKRTRPGMAAAFLAAARTPAPSTSTGAAVADGLRSLHRLLVRHGREFGHRTFVEAVRFGDLHALAGEADPQASLDRVVLQKVLPKIHGSVRELAEALNDIGSWCFYGREVDSSSPGFDAVNAVAKDAVLELSFDKVQRMARRLRANHFVSFAE